MQKWNQVIFEHHFYAKKGQKMFFGEPSPKDLKLVTQENYSAQESRSVSHSLSDFI